MRASFALLAVCVCLAVTPRALAQSGTAFTYQGELKNNGELANGAFDMTFALWNAVSGGGQVGTNIALADVPVVDGRFSVELDYGADAFNNQRRYLEIAVEGFTLSPRQPITRSPYSIQTRGIFVNDQSLVGIGTTQPSEDARLTVNANGQFNAIRAVSGAAAWPTIYGFNGNVLGHVLHADGIADAKLHQGGVVIVGQTDGENLAIDGNEIMARNNGAASTLHLNLEGGHIVTGGRLGVGVNPGFAQLAVHDTDPGAAFGLEVETTQQSALPSIYASNLAGGPVIWALGSSDVRLEGGGFIVAGEETGENLAIDNNEIMARNDGRPSTLHLNLEGGWVVMGKYAIKPAYAYGKILDDGTIVSASANVRGVTFDNTTAVIDVEGGVFSDDVVLVTDADGSDEAVSMQVRIVNADLRVSAFGDVNGWQRTHFNFVIYRP